MDNRIVVEDIFDAILRCLDIREAFVGLTMCGTLSTVLGQKWLETGITVSWFQGLILGGCNVMRSLKYKFPWETLRRFCFSFNGSLVCNVVRMPPSFLMYFNDNLGHN
jgi:hypothetical protein